MVSERILSVTGGLLVRGGRNVIEILQDFFLNFCVAKCGILSSDTDWLSL